MKYWEKCKQRLSVRKILTAINFSLVATNWNYYVRTKTTKEDLESEKLYKNRLQGMCYSATILTQFTSGRCHRMNQSQQEWLMDTILIYRDPKNYLDSEKIKHTQTKFKSKIYEQFRRTEVGDRHTDIVTY